MNLTKIFNIAIIIIVLSVTLVIFNSCSDAKNMGPDTSVDNTQGSVNEEQSKISEPEKQTAEEYIEEMLSSMSIDEKIYQMLFVTPESITGVGQVIQAGEGTKNALQKHPVGGIIYFSQNILDYEQVQKMLANCQSFSKIPLFIGVDEEGGRVSRLEAIGIKKQPPMKEIGDTGNSDEAYRVGSELGTDLSKLGFNVNFAPVADVLTNSSNQVIGDRAFSTDPQVVSKMVAREVEGLQENGVSAALKHFPGHGNTVTDSHAGYAESTKSMDELRNCEFLPFKSGIAADVDFVMTAHITTPNATKEKVPASLSEKLISDCLIDELGFKGIVITDSFQMGAITENYTNSQAVIKAIEAGVDMILMPPDVVAAHTALKTAVEDGVISEERINHSVRKILSTKIKRNLISDF